jgi:hypothetical protein
MKQRIVREEDSNYLCIVMMHDILKRTQISHQ